jgi:hydroxypyruvate reductase
MHPDSDDVIAHLRACHRAALAAVAPGPALARALSQAVPPATAPVVLACGKAAPAMASAYCTWLAGHGLSPSGGLVVTHVPAPSPHASLPLLLGDHPVPGARSFAAADALGALIARLAPGVPVEVLLSGGTSSLIGAPREGTGTAAYIGELRELLGAGRDIAAINAIRRQTGRWAGGRLGAALGDRPVRAWVLSDVPGDDLATIGSGPLVPDPGAPPVIPHVLIGGGHDALEGAASAWGGDVVRHAAPLAGEAAAEAHAIVAQLAGTRPLRPTLHLWAGETFVTVPPGAGRGGRSQQFALAAAGALARLPDTAPAITILAAGTDGQDGETPAAGAIVDGTTWYRIARRGGDPGAALRRCDAFPALLRADALLVTGPTGTNVADLVLAAVAPAP